jgi:hypothetical protein
LISASAPARFRLSMTVRIRIVRKGQYTVFGGHLLRFARFASTK